MAEAGTRVGAAYKTEGNTVYLFGFGTYVGDEVPFAEAAGWMAEAAREAGIPNPKIVLDNGKVVWGCECWWGPEDLIKKHFDGMEVKFVDIDEVRAQRAARKAAQESGTN